jgi:signal transduction histidine kinase/DNA-binding response OmpR family regulator
MNKMTDQPIHLLLVEDSPTDALFLQEALAQVPSAQFRLTHRERLAEALDHLSQEPCDVILLDLGLPDSQGLGTLVKLLEQTPRTPIVVLTGLEDEALGVQLIQAGAQDYLVKGQVSSSLLLRSVRYAIERKQVQVELSSRVRQQAAVAELGQRALASSEQITLFVEATTLVAQTLGVEYSHVLELLPDQDTLRWRAGLGQPAGLVDQERFEFQSDSHLGHTLLASEPVIVTDFRTETRFKEAAWLLDAGVVSGMSVVIEGQEWPFGILGVYTRQLQQFSQDDIHFLQAVAHILAAAVERQRVEAALQNSIQEFEIAYRQAIIYAQELNEEVKERKQAEAKVLHLNVELEQRVIERTMQLSAANAELARAARLKDEFLANMSHELRTPLNAILGLSEALLKQTANLLSERQLNSLRLIEESGHHLLALINDILDVSKIEAGRFDLQLGPVSVEAICQVSLQFVRQAALKKGINIAFQTFSASITMQADGRRLKQILINLLSNAVKFTPQGGQVGLEVTTEPDQDVIHFTVWDTGIGISQADLAQLFKPFVQLDSSLSRQYEGTGLGLVLISRLAELHRGSVSVTSEVGQGSRFTVSLPGREILEIGKLVEPVAMVQDGVTSPRSPDRVDLMPRLSPPVREGEQEKGALTNLDSPQLKPPLILLVEDNEANIQFLTDYLTDEDYRIVVARNGLEAIERVKEDRPALVLMDIQMPGMDGLEATRRIRAGVELADIPIVALTALTMPGDRERCLAAGANDYVSKPVSLGKLVSLIETYLEPIRVRED